MMKKRTIAAALSLLLCCFGANALAKTETNGGLTIESENGDWAFDANGRLMITKAGSYTLSGSGESVTIDDVNSPVTLTLDGVTLSYNSGAALKTNNSAKTTIVLKDKNILTGGNSSNATLDNGTNPLEITCTGCGTAGHTCGELTVTSDSYGCAAIGSGNSNPCSNLTISGGRISADGGSSAASIGSGVDGKCSNLTISGGTVTATNTGTAIGAGNRGTVDGITISGGTVVATSTGFNAAAIGSGGTDLLGSTRNYGAVKNITISGGDITAISKGTGSGIGSGGYSPASGITISGGNISVQASSGAGIGSGANQLNDSLNDASNITISGGNIDIRFDHGAGIGSGWLGNASGIIISGGSITATPSAGGGGAGIGSGWHGNADGITISGGEIDVQSRSGAGIGSGSSGDAKNIIISGGKISVQASYGAGIGTGSNGKARNITISGGSIEAAGGRNADGVGAGTNGSASGIVIAPEKHRITANVSTTGFSSMTELEGSPFTSGKTDVTEQVHGFQYFKTIGEYVGSIDMPATGDNASLTLWASLLALSATLFGVRRRRAA